MAGLVPAIALETPQGSFEAGEGTFLLNGEPYVVKAAELHYPRIPEPYSFSTCTMMMGPPSATVRSPTCSATAF